MRQRSTWWQLALLTGVVVLGWVFISCVDSTLPQQGDVICPAGQLVVGERCGMAAEIAACAAVSHGAHCTTVAISDGWCDAGVCYPIVCGNSVLEPGEVCDDGNTIDNDGCKSDCLSWEVCGDGVLNRGAGEQCDDGNRVDADGCQANCQFAFCGDGVIDPTEGCDSGTANSNVPAQAGVALCRTHCQWSACGDAVKDAGEICDDGNRVDLVAGGNDFDGCSANCLSVQTCGNGYIDLNPDPTRSEECDPVGSVPGLSHDGCSSTCKREFADWTEQRANEPSPRRDHAMAFDSRRNKLVVFGGLESSNQGTGEVARYLGVGQRVIAMAANAPCTFAVSTDKPIKWCLTALRGVMVMFGGYSATNYAGYQSDTWEWDGIDWTQRATPTAPSPRYGFGCSFDSDRQRVVLVGGASASGEENDVWEYDGTTWSLIEPIGVRLSRRQLLGQSYDAVRKRIVVYGGTAANSQETWLWDGDARTWTQASDGPGFRYGMAMEFDPRLGKVVLFGNQAGSNDTWTWDGDSWQAIAVVLAPSSRGGTALSFATDINKLLMFGGINPSSANHDQQVWQFDNSAGATWTPLRNARIPPPRRLGQAAISTDGLLLVFSGYRAPADTWIWRHDIGWRQQGGGPTERARALLVFDSKHNRYLLFSGYHYDGGGYQHDMWSFGNGQWTQLHPATMPSARFAVDGYYDPKRDRVVMYGGYDGAAGNETWEYDCSLNDWQKMTTVGSPDFDAAGAMAYDAKNDRGVLIKGSFTASRTWFYQVVNGQATWTALPATAVQPSPRAEASAVYDPLRRSVVLFGGNNGGRSTSEVWELHDDAWQLVATTTSPSARSTPLVGYDQSSASIVMFGGSDVSSLNDTWLLRWTATSEREQDCPLLGEPAAVDTDSDGQDSVLDPDCWWRRTPLCPPGTSCVP